MFDVRNLVKYLLEGVAVAVAAYYIPRKTSNIKEILMIAFTASTVFAVLDAFSPIVAEGARYGTGFRMGYNLTGGGCGNNNDNDNVDNDDDSDEEYDQDGSDGGEAYAKPL